MDTETTKSEVVDFLDRYILAFSPNSGVRIADLYHAPCLLVRGDQSVHVLTSDAEVDAFFRPVAESLWSAGTTSWRTEHVTVTAVGSKSAFVVLTWTPLRADGTAIRSWQQAYNLIRVDHAWRILVSTMLVGAA